MKLVAVPHAETRRIEEHRKAVAQSPCRPGPQIEGQAVSAGFFPRPPGSVLDLLWWTRSLLHLARQLRIREALANNLRIT